MALQNLGGAPSRQTDLVDVGWIMSTFPSYSTYISTDVDYAITLPMNPADHQMQLYEIYAGANITVTLPGGVIRTEGPIDTIHVPATKTAFLGLRYSSHKPGWFLLSSTLQL